MLVIQLAFVCELIMTSVPDADICEPAPSAGAVEKHGMPWLVSERGPGTLERVHSLKKGCRSKLVFVLIFEESPEKVTRVDTFRMRHDFLSLRQQTQITLR